MNDVKSQINLLVSQLDAFEDETLTRTDEKKLAKVKALLGVTPKLALLEALHAHYKTCYNAIYRDDLPMALAEAGLLSAVTDDGTEVSTVTAYTTKTNDKERVAVWLNENGYGAIIKDTLALEKGAFTPALEETLMAMGVSYTRDSSVNGSQLKATIKNHLEHGGAMPPKDAISVEVHIEAKIKKLKGSL